MLVSGTCGTNNVNFATQDLIDAFTAEMNYIQAVLHGTPIPPPSTLPNPGGGAVPAIANSTLAQIAASAGAPNPGAITAAGSIQNLTGSTPAPIASSSDASSSTPAAASPTAHNTAHNQPVFLTIPACVSMPTQNAPMVINDCCSGTSLQTGTCQPAQTSDTGNSHGNLLLAAVLAIGAILA